MCEWSFKKTQKFSNLHLVVEVGDVADDNDALADVVVGATFVGCDVIVTGCDAIIATLVCVTYKLDFFVGASLLKMW